MNLIEELRMYMAERLLSVASDIVPDTEEGRLLITHVAKYGVEAFHQNPKAPRK